MLPSESEEENVLIILLIVPIFLLFQNSPPTQTPVATSTSPSPVPAAPSPVPPATNPATSTPVPSNPLNTSGQGNNKENIASELAAALLRQYDTGMEGDILSESMSDQLQVSLLLIFVFQFQCHKLTCSSPYLHTTFMSIPVDHVRPTIQVNLFTVVVVVLPFPEDVLF